MLIVLPATTFICMRYMLCRRHVRSLLNHSWIFCYILSVDFLPNSSLVESSCKNCNMYIHTYTYQQLLACAFKTHEDEECRWKLMIIWWYDILYITKLRRNQPSRGRMLLVVFDLTGVFPLMDDWLAKTKTAT